MSQPPSRVLLVEDNADDALLLLRALREGGPPRFSVDVAGSLAEGERLLAQGAFDVVLLDLHLPDGCGLEVVHRLVRLRPDLPVVVLTGLDDDVAAVEAVKAGAQDYLVKGEADRRSLERAMLHAIERKRGVRESVLTALDRFPVGVILMNDDKRVFLHNRAAGEILAAGDGLVLDGGVLRATTAGDEERLRALLQGAAAPPTGLPADGLAITRRRGRPLSVLVAPLKPRAGAIVFVADPERQVHANETILERLYGLTPAEARVAWRLMQGMSLEETVDELGITIHTGRTQLKRILGKTATRRQGELIRLLMAGPAPMGVIHQVVVFLGTALVARLV